VVGKNNVENFPFWQEPIPPLFGGNYEGKLGRRGRQNKPRRPASRSPGHYRRQFPNMKVRISTSEVKGSVSKEINGCRKLGGKRLEARK